MGHSKSSSNRKEYSDTSLRQETKQISDSLTSYLKEIEKEKKSTVSERKKQKGPEQK